jgi:CHAT domain
MLMRSTAESAMARLTEEVVGPVCDAIGERRIVVCPVGGLGALPWPLLARRTACVVPSASWWLQTRSSLDTGATGKVSVCVGPDLPGALVELLALTELYPHARTLTVEQATIQAVLEHCADAELMHLACHATFRARSPLLSTLSLRDGPLAAFELERLERAPAAVVLAACASGAVRHYASGDGLGLSMALLTAGTRVVLSATLPLPDAAASGFFATFHRRLAARETAGDALSGAIGETDLHDAAQLAVAAAMICHGHGDWQLSG